MSTAPIVSPRISTAAPVAPVVKPKFVAESVAGEVPPGEKPIKRTDKIRRFDK